VPHRRTCIRRRVGSPDRPASRPGLRAPPVPAGRPSARPAGVRKEWVRRCPSRDERSGDEWPPSGRWTARVRARPSRTCWCGRRWRARCCCAERVAPVARRLGRDRTGRTTTRHVAGGGPRPPTSSRRGFSASLPHSPHRSAGPVVMSSPLPRSHTADRGSTDLASQRATAQEARHPEGGPLPTAPSHRPRTAPQPADRCRHSPVPAVGELLLQGHRHEHHGGPRP
jgi:hypothetical protein